MNEATSTQVLGHNIPALAGSAPEEFSIAPAVEQPVSDQDQEWHNILADAGVAPGGDLLNQSGLHEVVSDEDWKALRTTVPEQLDAELAVGSVKELESYGRHVQDGEASKQAGHTRSLDSIGTVDLRRHNNMLPEDDRLSDSTIAERAAAELRAVEDKHGSDSTAAMTKELELESAGLLGPEEVKAFYGRFDDQRVRNERERTERAKAERIQEQHRAAMVEPDILGLSAKAKSPVLVINAPRVERVGDDISTTDPNTPVHHAKQAYSSPVVEEHGTNLVPEEVPPVFEYDYSRDVMVAGKQPEQSGSGTGSSGEGSAGLEAALPSHVGPSEYDSSFSRTYSSPERPRFGRRLKAAIVLGVAAVGAVSAVLLTGSAGGHVERAPRTSISHVPQNEIIPNQQDGVGKGHDPSTYLAPKHADHIERINDADPNADDVWSMATQGLHNAGIAHPDSRQVRTYTADILRDNNITWRQASHLGDGRTITIAPPHLRG
ncbi:MAG TPA: hypothetical protein VLH38_04005 [Patescibacteria group bacterium]|nr:hypothetical protein [Patescibacteria group bacterium]